MLKKEGPFYNYVLLWLMEYSVGLGDTDDTTIYRDTKFPRYRYRQDDDTFWYRDTTNIAVLMTIFWVKMY